MNSMVAKEFVCDTPTLSLQTDLNHNKKNTTESLLKLLRSSLPPALRVPLADSFVTLFSATDFSSILETVTSCNECIKSKDDNIANRL